MATGFLILHGVENHRPPEHWQFLLAARLVEHGLEVRYPALPEPDAPELERWLATLEQELAALGGEQRVVVCHSLACLLWFHAAGRGADGAVERLLLVSPPASERVPDSGASFRLDSFDAETVRASVQGEIAIACSDADPCNPTGAQSMARCSIRVPSPPPCRWLTERRSYLPRCTTRSCKGWLTRSAANTGRFSAMFARRSSDSYRCPARNSTPIR
jgi:predicted alpha/beta hydrolase family esterase